MKCATQHRFESSFVLSNTKGTIYTKAKGSNDKGAKIDHVIQQILNEWIIVINDANKGRPNFYHKNAETSNTEMCGDAILLEMEKLKVICDKCL